MITRPPHTQSSVAKTNLAAAPSQGTPDADSGVPERPLLAPGVRPAGQMKESAFAEPPWLLEREGEGYVQVTRLLYRIAELCDGQHTVEQIAREVSTAERRRVSADNVRQLVATQLILKGLVRAPDGSVATRQKAARSALAVARLKMIDPRLLDGLTSGLEVLYVPPVLVAVLLASALAEAWLYLVHGVGAGLHDAFSRSWLMVLLLGALVLSAGFHELGHAAALRYAGGKVRGMGFGFYLMYPAFFTDVSDNYRLSRWPRVRTDLGGFYFNLIFSLGVFAIYLVTRYEVLLLVVVLTNLEIIHQLLPFVRLDGYWALADLTGIPDFFSRMGAFLRSVLPLSRTAHAERTLPELRWWGKTVFLAYIAITIPALAFLTFLLLRSLPRVVVTAWEGLGQQGHSLVDAQARGDVLQAAGAVLQALLIGLSLAGLAFSVFRVATGVGGLLWRWSTGSVWRRGVVGVVVTGLLAIVYGLWVPQDLLPGRPASPLYARDTYRPIAREERMNLADAAAGVAVPRPPEADLPELPASLAAPSETTPPTTLPSASPDATSQGRSTPGATPTPGPVRSPTSLTTAATGTRPTSAATNESGTPRPTATVSSASDERSASTPPSGTATGTPQLTTSATRVPTACAATPSASRSSSGQGRC